MQRTGPTSRVKPRTSHYPAFGAFALNQHESENLLVHSPTRDKYEFGRPSIPGWMLMIPARASHEAPGKSRMSSHPNEDIRGASGPAFSHPNEDISAALGAEVLSKRGHMTPPSLDPSYT